MLHPDPTLRKSRFFANSELYSSYAIWIVVAVLAVAGFLHLDADFPNHSRWMDDAAKFTDEGWYASGALNHALTGHWLRPGDFNPVVAIPVWSALVAALFHFTGIGLAPARALAFAFLLAGVLAAAALLLRQHRNLAPSLALLLISSPLLFFFSRIAILEPALLFFLIAAAYAAHLGSASTARQAACGLFFVLAMLTKSSAVFAAPAILYLIWFPLRDRPSMALRAVSVSLATVVLGYGLYWMLIVRTHPVDMRILYEQNRPYLGLKSIPKAARILYRSYTWIDPVLFPVAVVTVLGSLGPLRALWRDPLYGFSVALYVGYSGFLLLHFDAGPRYFAVLVLPVTVVVLLAQQMLRQKVPALGRALQLVIVVVVGLNIVTIFRHLARPSYTLRDAQRAIRNRIDEDPTVTRLLIGHGAAEATFVTHIPALDDIGDSPVARKFSVEHPGWLVTYSDNLSILTQPGIAGMYTFTPRGRYFVLDAPSRQYLLLYRISPAR